MFLAEKTLCIFYRKLKDKKKLHRMKKLQKVHVYFRLIFRLRLHILKDSSPILEHLQIREPLPIFKGFLKCMAPIAYTYFTKYEVLQHFILLELC